MTNADRDTYHSAIAADDAWMAEIRRTLRGRPGDLRYTRAAQGAPGTALRRAYDEYTRQAGDWLATMRKA